MTKMRKALLLLVGLGGLLFAGLSGGVWSVILLVGVIGLFTIIYRKPGVAQVIVARRWIIAGAGAALLVLSLGLIFVSIPPLSIAGQSVNLVDVVVGGHAVGVMLIVLPFIVRSMGETRIRTGIKGNPAPLPTHPFDGIHQGVRAMRYIVERPGQFARLAAPWLVAEVAISLLIVGVAAHMPKGRQPGYASVLAILLLVFAATLLSLTLYAVLWQRLALRSELPALTRWPPIRVWWSYAWRCWVFSYVINLIGKQWITWGLAQASSFHLDLSLARGVLGISFAALAVLLASTYALILPGVATGRRQQMGYAPIAARRLGWRFTAGLAIAASPYLISLVIPAERGSQAILSPLSLALMFVAFLLGLFGIASGATYLSWTYLAVEGMQGSD